MRVGLKPKASGFIKNGRGLCMEHTHVKAEAGGKPRKPRLARSHQKLEETENNPSLEPSERAQLYHATRAQRE